MRTLLLLLSTSLATAHAAAEPAAPPAVSDAQFGRELDEFITRLRSTSDVPPGTAIVVLKGERTIFAKAYGTRDNRTRAPLTLDTPMYNASVTKAYTGVLAAMLDEEGKLPVTSSLIDVWPGLTLPAPLDAKAVTLAGLLSHSSGIREGGLNFRSVWTGQISAKDVPILLSQYARPGRDGFAYDNIGPFIWSAAAERRTGIAWRDMLQQRLLKPLGMRHSSARLEDFGEDGVARCHTRNQASWRADRPKQTATLNAAGGMYTSARDAAQFLGIAMTGGASAKGKVSTTAVRRSMQKIADQTVDMWGMKRDGYGLGWDLGSYNGHRFISRSGGYPGCRAIVYFAPELDLGIVAFSNGGIGANTVHAAIIAQAVDVWTRNPAAASLGAKRIGDTQAELRKAIGDYDTPDPRLAAIRPIDPAAWQDVIGSYSNKRLGDGALSIRDGRLWLTMGVAKLGLNHIGGNAFLVDPDGESRSETFDLVRDGNGKVIAFMWTDDRYDRVAR